MSDADADGDGSAGWRSTAGRVARVAGLLLLLAVVIPFVVYAVPQVAGADHSYVVLSGSMQPTMNPGDVVIVDDVPASEIEQGDIVTFGSGSQGTPTTHRVIEVVEREDGVAFRTKGDNNEDADSQLVTPDSVRGRVPYLFGYPFVIPLIGYVINFASTSVGFLALVVIPMGLLILSEVWVMGRRFRSGDEQSGADGDEQSGADGDAGPAPTDVGASVPDDATVPADRDPGPADAADGPAADTVPTGPVTHVDSAAIPGGNGTSPGMASNGHSPEVVYVDRNGDGSSSTASRDAETVGDADDGGVTFTAAELELGLVVLAGFLAYSVWVAVDTFEVWAFTVAGSVAAAFLLIGGLYVAGRLGSGGSRDTEDAKVASSGGEPGEASDRASDDVGSGVVAKAGDDPGAEPVEPAFDPETAASRAARARANADALLWAMEVETQRSADDRDDKNVFELTVKEDPSAGRERADD